MTKAAELAKMGEVLTNSHISGRRNLIINGDFQCWQRGTSATNAANNYLADRFRTNESTSGTWTVEQSSDHPTGAGFSLKSQVTGADTSITGGEYAYLHQNIEAQNLQGLNYGTSDAKDFTLSFWVKSNKTGTYCIVVRKFDNTTYHLVHEFSISSANTWEKKIITITPTAGSTSLITASAGAFDNNTGAGFQIGWILVMGSSLNGGTNNTWTSTTSHYATTNQVNWMDSTDNNFYLAQVQLEIGSIATPFEHRSFGEELALCQRYFYKTFPQSEVPATHRNEAVYHFQEVYASGDTVTNFSLPVDMRADPTVVFYPGGSTSGGSAGDNSYYDGSWKNGGTTLLSTQTSSKNISWVMNGTSSMTLQQYNLTADADY